MQVILFAVARSIAIIASETNAGMITIGIMPIATGTIAEIIIALIRGIIITVEIFPIADMKTGTITTMIMVITGMKEGTTTKLITMYDVAEMKERAK